MATATIQLTHSILQPSSKSHFSSDSSFSAESSSSSHTSLSDARFDAHKRPATNPQPTMTTTAQGPRPRRIRFAPLPDPHRAVLITDDGDELPIPLVDDNTFPTSLLLPITTAAFASTQPIADACDPDPPQLANSAAELIDPAGSSGSSTNSYLSSASSSASASVSSTPRTATPSEYSPVSSVGSSPVALHSALPTNGKSGSALYSVPAAKSSVNPAASSSSAAANTSSSSSTSSPPSLSSSQPKSRAGLSLLRPFRKTSTVSSSSSSSHSLTPTPSIDAVTPSSAHSARKALSGLTAEEILTLGTINLFRTSSRDSADSSSTTTTSGWGLARWSSAGGNNSNANHGDPLFRTQSTQSYKSKSKSLFGSSPLASSSSSTTSTTSSLSSKTSSSKNPPKPTSPPASRHKGARMLNGRVYGSKRPTGPPVNPFATARDEEIEFVEWGYGGMGSVKGAKSAGVSGGGGGVNWERLSGGVAAGSNGAPLKAVGGRRGVEHDERRREMGIGGTAGLGTVGSIPEEDDGSGMGWVKKRREERERKAREAKEAAEKEAKEAAEKAAAPEANEETEEVVLSEEPSEIVPATDEEIIIVDAVPGDADREDDAGSESEMSTPTPTRASTVDGGGPFAGHAGLGMTPLVAPTKVGGEKVESEAKEAEEKTEAEAEDKDGEERGRRSGMPTPNASVMNILALSDASPSPIITPSTAEITTAAGAPEALDAGETEPAEQEHIPMLVPVPARHHHHHHHNHPRPSHARTTSHGSLAASGDAGTTAPLADDAAGAAAAAGEQDGTLVASPTSSGSSASSSSDDEDDDEVSTADDSDNSEDEDDDDEEAEADGVAAQRRKTMLGAGVEKVMRHKE